MLQAKVDSLPSHQLIKFLTSLAAVGPNNSYVTATNAGAPSWVGWSQQLNLTYVLCFCHLATLAHNPTRYSPLTLTSNSTGYTYQPEGYVYGSDGIINGTMAVMLTDLDLFVTPFNTSMLNPHIVALGMYMAG